jgi:hypothetical protein
MRLIGKQVAEDFRSLSADISTNNTESQRKFSFYAGIAATGTFIASVSGVIIALAIRFFGSHP